MPDADSSINNMKMVVQSWRLYGIIGLNNVCGETALFWKIDDPYGER
jgi:hypothetical protein